MWCVRGIPRCVYANCKTYSRRVRQPAIKNKPDGAEKRRSRRKFQRRRQPEGQKIPYAVWRRSFRRGHRLISFLPQGRDPPSLYFEFVFFFLCSPPCKSSQTPVFFSLSFSYIYIKIGQHPRRCLDHALHAEPSSSAHHFCLEGSKATTLSICHRAPTLG